MCSSGEFKRQKGTAERRPHVESGTDMHGTVGGQLKAIPAQQPLGVGEVTLQPLSIDRIFLYFAPSNFSFILTSVSVPVDEKQPHNMMLPPSCFTAWMVFFG